MTLQFFCDWLWAPIIAPIIIPIIARLASHWKSGRHFLRRLVIGNTRVAIIGDSDERSNISKSLATTGLFKEKNISCETFQNANNAAFNSRFDIVVIVFDYDEKLSDSDKDHISPDKDHISSQQKKAEERLEECLKSFKTTDEPIVVFARNNMNQALFKKIADRPNASICQARGRLTADIVAQLTAFNG